MAVGWADLPKAARAKARITGGVCAIVRVEAKLGFDEEFAGLLADLAFAVRAEERDCLSYAVTRQMGSRQHFAIHARFKDWRAFRRHAETPHMNRMLPRLNALMAAPIALEIFLEA
jgi:quinol monooxygenase YgiN